MNDSTSQMGASVPKATTDPAGVDAGEFATVLDPLFDPHPIISAAAKRTAAHNNKSIILLRILASSIVIVVSFATPAKRCRIGPFSPDRLLGAIAPPNATLVNRTSSEVR
ncbi:MAG: hypothetical protein ACLQVL_02335 [Terriglobia bacterium]